MYAKGFGGLFTGCLGFAVNDFFCGVGCVLDLWFSFKVYGLGWRTFIMVGFGFGCFGLGELGVVIPLGLLKG